MPPHSNEPVTWRNCVSRRHFNAFNAIYVKAVDTIKHPHILPITFLIFNQLSSAKSFEKLRLNAFHPYQILYMLTLSIQGVSISNAFNAIYVKAANTFSTQYTHM